MRVSSQVKVNFICMVNVIETDIEAGGRGFAVTSRY